jgi:hypothetical protein
MSQCLCMALGFDACLYRFKVKGSLLSQACCSLNEDTVYSFDSYVIRG